jgi:HEPN domain-containing protein
MSKEYQDWVEKAEEDYRTAEKMIQAKPPAYNVVCFHGQQCMEKYLKSILALNDLFIERTHALDYLCNKTTGKVPQLAFYQDELSKADAFSVQIRYPGHNADKKDAARILKLAKTLRTIIRQYLGLKDKKR